MDEDSRKAMMQNKRDNMRTARTNGRFRRRAGAYVMVLATSMLIALLGITSVTVNRLKFRTGHGLQQAEQARLLARSAIDIGYYSIDQNDNWFNDIDEDSWTTRNLPGGLSLEWKIVDAASAERAIDPARKIRLLGRGTVGEAVRVFSILLEPGETGNLLTNPAAESGVSPWQAIGDVDLTRSAAHQRGGDFSLFVVPRSNVAGAVSQKISADIVNGKTYQIEAWYYPQTTPDTAKISMLIESTDGVFEIDGASVAIESKRWHQLTATVTPVWTGERSVVAIVIASGTAMAQFYVDDCYFGLSDSVPYPVSVVEGSWRRESDTD